jgi:hypothetical protein
MMNRFVHSYYFYRLVYTYKTALPERYVAIKQSLLFQEHQYVLHTQCELLYTESLRLF